MTFYPFTILQMHEQKDVALNPDARVAIMNYDANPINGVINHGTMYEDIDDNNDVNGKVPKIPFQKDQGVLFCPDSPPDRHERSLADSILQINARKCSSNEVLDI